MTATVTVSRSAPWLMVATGRAEETIRPLNRRRLVVQVLGLGLVVAVVVTLAAGLVARQIAQTVAVQNATHLTEVLALDVVQPSLADGVATENAADVARLDAVVRQRVLSSNIARVKLWTAAGEIVYSDDARLIGRTFTLGTVERRAFGTNEAHAEVSNLSDPDNADERGHGTLLEVIQAVRTPNGTPMLLEVYFDYGAVTSQQNALWMQFAVVTAGSLLLLLAGLAPLLRGLVRNLERGRVERELLLQKAINASDAERRRIAGLLHDGPVQELVGASYFIGAAGGGLAGTDAGLTLENAEATVRATVDTLRVLLLDIYPPGLTESGLACALDALGAGNAARGTSVTVDVAAGLHLSERAEQLMFRVARETMTNAIKHGDGEPVTITITRERHKAILVVRDSGPGFDAETLISHPPTGHFGLQLLRDAVSEGGVDASLAVQSAAGSGTSWRLMVTA